MIALFQHVADAQNPLQLAVEVAVIVRIYAGDHDRRIPSPVCPLLLGDKSNVYLFEERSQALDVLLLTSSFEADVGADHVEHHEQAGQTEILHRLHVLQRHADQQIEPAIAQSGFGLLGGCLGNVLRQRPEAVIPGFLWMLFGRGYKKGMARVGEETDIWLVPVVHEHVELW